VLSALVVLLFDYQNRFIPAESGPLIWVSFSSRVVWVMTIKNIGSRIGQISLNLSESPIAFASVCESSSQGTTEVRQKRVSISRVSTGAETGIPRVLQAFGW